MDKKERAKYKEKKVSIAGYSMTTFKIGDRYTINIPTGKNPKDKAMFDELVYYNTLLLWENKREDVIKNIKFFIKQYKLKKKSEEYRKKYG